MSRITNAVAGIAGAIIIAATVWWLLPSSIWFEVRSVQVLDATVNESPRMVVDRSVHQEFEGSWIVTILKVVDKGFVPVCTATGDSAYSPDSMFPPNLDLDWWTWPTQCRMQPGQFVVRTVWTLHVLPKFDKTVRAVSNIFTISPE